MILPFSTFETFLLNSSFLLSFLITVYYWIKSIFSSDRNYQFYGFNAFLFLNIIISLQLIIRWVDSGHFPLSSLYESLLFLSWSISTIYLIIENFLQKEFIGILIAPLLLCIIGFTGFSLPGELQYSKPLVPALQSNWLFMHVSVMILSYAGLLVGSILSITYIVISFFSQSKTSLLDNQNTSILEAQPETLLSTFNSDMYSKSSVPQNTTPLKSLPDLLLIFDNLSYRTIGIGFCFLTLGILSGAVWANETWGTYWSWDPKETWALITWLAFAAYLHTRLIYGWKGKKPAIIASIGFLFIWVCYLGVNLLGKGLHSYGFFN